MNQPQPQAPFTYPFIVFLYQDGREFSSHNSPSHDVARGVIAWHVSKSVDHTGKIVDRATGESETFRSHEEQAVSIATGEICECPNCAEMSLVVKGIQRTNQGLILQMAQLRKDLLAEAKNDPAWRTANDIFDFWRIACNHRAAKFSLDRWQIIVPFLKTDKLENIYRAIAGANYDPYVTERKNGSKKRHDGWDLIFRDRAKFEEFACRCPKGFVPPNLDISK